MSDGPKTPFTLAEWQVRPGQEEAFMAAWVDLGKVFSALPQAPPWGSLLRSLQDPHLFYSFGPWPSLEAIQHMRSDPGAQAALERLRGLCTAASPGAYELVRHVTSD